MWAEEGGVNSLPCKAVIVHPQTLSSLRCRHGERRVFTERQKLLAPRAKRREVIGEPHAW